MHGVAVLITADHALTNEEESDPLTVALCLSLPLLWCARVLMCCRDRRKARDDCHSKDGFPLIKTTGVTQGRAYIILS